MSGDATMKLIRLTDEAWVNPEHVASVYIETFLRGKENPNYDYAVMVSVVGGYRPFLVSYCRDRKEAESVLYQTTQQLMMSANGYASDNSSFAFAMGGTASVNGGAK